MKRRPTDLEVARAIAHNESLRTPEPRELDTCEVMALFDEPADIVVIETDAPIADSRYTATVGDYDLDCTVGTGPTPLAAIVDLLDQLER